LFSADAKILEMEYRWASFAMFTCANIAASILLLNYGHQISLDFHIFAAGTATGSAPAVDAAYNLADLIAGHPLEVAKATEHVLEQVALATAEAVETIRRRKLPIFYLFRSGIPEIWDFNVGNLTRRPDWHMLFYLGARSPLADANRAWKDTVYGHLRATARPLTELHEFPYASTAQGGVAGPAVADMLDRGQNRREGAWLKNFYGSKMNGKPGVFLLVPVPV
jgi:hypothetical protein